MTKVQSAAEILTTWLTCAAASWIKLRLNVQPVREREREREIEYSEEATRHYISSWLPPDTALCNSMATIFPSQSLKPLISSIIWTSLSFRASSFNSPRAQKCSLINLRMQNASVIMSHHWSPKLAPHFVLHQEGWHKQSRMALLNDWKSKSNATIMADSRLSMMRCTNIALPMIAPNCA